MLFGRKTKIDWPFWVFGLITLGIVVSVGFLIFTLVTKPKVEQGVVSSAEFEAKVQQVKEEVRLNYKKALVDLVTTVESKEDLSAIKSELQKVFLSVRVPSDYLEIHLQTWLKIDKLSENNFKTEVLNILQDLQNKVK